MSNSIPEKAQTNTQLLSKVYLYLHSIMSKPAINTQRPRGVFLKLLATLLSLQSSPNFLKLHLSLQKNFLS